jgi:hypothetical protein
MAYACLLAMALPAAAFAQVTPAAAPAPALAPVGGTRLDVVAMGEVTRVPDLVRVSAGVVTQAQSATEALRLNGAQMTRVRAALRAAGIADRDIQTSNISLQPDYRHAENQPPVLTGYRASNEVSVRFRNIADTGRILDALVAQGANSINGPMLEIERPEAALDEARTAALTNARARAELYARSLGMRVVRVLSVSEAGMPVGPQFEPMMRLVAADSAGQAIDPGEQRLSVNLTVSFELR